MRFELYYYTLRYYACACMRAELFIILFSVCGFCTAVTTPSYSFVLYRYIIFIKYCILFVVINYGICRVHLPTPRIRVMSFRNFSPSFIYFYLSHVRNCVIKIQKIQVYIIWYTSTRKVTIVNIILHNNMRNTVLFSQFNKKNNRHLLRKEDFTITCIFAAGVLIIYIVILQV